MVETRSIVTRCPIGGEEKTLVVEAAAFDYWKDGAYVQEAFPNMHEDDRERLITGVCPDCWSSLFPDETED